MWKIKVLLALASLLVFFTPALSTRGVKCPFSFRWKKNPDCQKRCELRHGQVKIPDPEDSEKMVIVPVASGRCWFKNCCCYLSKPMRDLKDKATQIEFLMREDRVSKALRAEFPLEDPPPPPPPLQPPPPPSPSLSQHVHPEPKVVYVDRVTTPTITRNIVLQPCSRISNLEIPQFHRWMFVVSEDQVLAFEKKDKKSQGKKKTKEPETMKAKLVSVSSLPSKKIILYQDRCLTGTNGIRVANKIVEMGDVPHNSLSCTSQHYVDYIMNGHTGAMKGKFLASNCPLQAQFTSSSLIDDSFKLKAKKG